MIDRFSRPPLATHLQQRAGALNHRALSLVEQMLVERILVDTQPASDADCLGRLAADLAASAACWQIFRPRLKRSRRREVKRNLARRRAEIDRLRLQSGKTGVRSFAQVAEQAVWFEALARGDHDRKTRRALRRLQRALNPPRSPALPLTGLSPGPLRRLKALLLAEVVWLEKLAAPAPGADSGAPAADSGAPGADFALLSGLTRIYTRARRFGSASPYSARGRRWLGHLRWSAELIAPRSGHIRRDGLFWQARDGAHLARLLDEHRWLRSLSSSAGRLGGLSAADAERVMALARIRSRALAGAISALQKRLLAADPERFAARLPWEVFCGLAPWPEYAEVRIYRAVQ